MQANFALGRERYIWELERDTSFLSLSPSFLPTTACASTVYTPPHPTTPPSHSLIPCSLPFVTSCDVISLGGGGWVREGSFHHLDCFL